jgi:beta-barrel assembly-enhancing protease
MKQSLFDAAIRKVLTWCCLVCFVTTSLVAVPGSGHALTLSEEKELGRKMLEKVREVLPLVEDGEIIAFAQSVGDRVAKQVGMTSYQFQFFVVNESVPNAFAMPGGYIFIYRGLIELMTNEGELAGILAHELAHIQQRHIHRRLEEGKLINMASVAGLLAGILLGMAGGGAGKAAGAVAMGSMAGAATYALQYSRENEKEADIVGLRYLLAAGYEPHDMVTIMERMNQDRWRVGSKVPSYMLTHPGLTERVEYLKDLARQNPSKGGKSSNAGVSVDFRMMQAALIADYSDPNVAMDRFQAEMRKPKGASSPAFVEYGLGRLLLRQGKTDEALPHLQEAARQASNSPFALSSLGALYYTQGKMLEAQRVLQTALVLNPGSSIAHLRLAKVLQETGQKEEALKHLYQIEALSPTFPEIDYHLGVLLGQVNRLGPAHYHLGRYYEQRRDWKLAFFHYQKAKALLTDNVQLLEEVTQSLKEVEKKKKETDWAPQKDTRRGAPGRRFGQY